MELAIPLVALGGMYLISNTSPSSKYMTKSNVNQKESFNNMGKNANAMLPNTNIHVENYPVMNNKELVDNVKSYPNPNSATDKYFNQNAYEEKERMGIDVGNNMQDIYSLTGNYMSSSEFAHNNMVPFNGKKPRGQIYNNNNAETILDNYSGGGSQVIKKIEQAPLFKPQDNVQWTYGTPNMSEFYQSRVNPAMKNHMVKPFESVHVGPGLNKGYTSDGSDGFNSGMESRDAWLPKTVDELRVATNPKIEYSLVSHEGPASSMIKNIGIQAKVEKNRPDTFFVNTQDRWLTTTGAEKAGQMIPEHIVKPSTRNETTRYQQGTPNSTIKTASYVPTKHEDTKRIQLEGFHVGHSAASKTAPHHSDKENYMNSHTNYENSRSMNNQAQTFGSGFTNAIGAVIAPIMDILKPSRKEEYSCNMRVYGNMGGYVPESYLSTNGDIPGTTIKETTLYQPNGYIGFQNSNGYIVSEQQPISNQRDTTTEHFALNPASSKTGNKQYDYVYRQTNNELKEKTTYSRFNQGNTNSFNGNVNMSVSKYETDRDNNRMWVPQLVNVKGPSAQTYGVTNIPQYNEKTNIGCERISPDLLNAFRENPYTHSLHSVA